MTDLDLILEQELELERAVARCQRRIDRAAKPRQQAKWDRALGMYIDEVERFSQ